MNNSFNINYLYLYTNSTYDQKRWAHNQPARPEVQRWTFARHLFDVFRQPRNTVEPTNRYHLEERQKHDRHRRCIVVDQLEKVDSTLNEIWKPKEEGDNTNDEHEQFMIDEFLFDPIGKPVLDGCDDHFNDGELLDRNQ